MPKKKKVKKPVKKQVKKVAKKTVKSKSEKRRQATKRKKSKKPVARKKVPKKTPKDPLKGAKVFKKGDFLLDAKDNRVFVYDPVTQSEVIREDPKRFTLTDKNHSEASKHKV